VLIQLVGLWFRVRDKVRVNVRDRVGVRVSTVQCFITSHGEYRSRPPKASVSEK